MTGAATKGICDFCGVAVGSSSPGSSLIRNSDGFLDLLETSVGGCAELFAICGW